MILVTGGTGLLGANLLAELIKQGQNVKAIKREKSNMKLVEKTFRRENVPFTSVEWLTADVTDVLSIKESMNGVDYVYHCAAVVSFNPSATQHMLNVNVNGTANVVNMATECGVKKLCHVSSTAALGRGEEETVITEESHWQNSRFNSVYAISKYGAEREVWRGMEEGLDAVIVNPSVILGAGDWATDSSRIIGQVAKGLLFYPKGGNAFVDVRDVVATMIKLMNSSISRERFLIVSENKSYKELFDFIADSLEKKRPAIRITNMLASLSWRAEWIRSALMRSSPIVTREIMNSSSRTYNYSNEKIRKATGVDFIPVKNSIKDTCRIFREEKNK
ncbi:MAG: SDR family NAD(P)-dependent oxidoreductase [Bacteroidia bacterium]|nr:SDR family NAD(P)-dependent oxidoreductase [Bacteroidia bacterium]